MSYELCCDERMSYFFAKLILNLKMLIDMPTNGLRRNGDAMKTNAGIIIYFIFLPSILILPGPINTREKNTIEYSIGNSNLTIG